MKRTVCILAILGLIGLCLPAQSQAQTKLTLHLSGGLNFLDGGDLRTGGEGSFDWWNGFIQAFGNTTSGSFSPANLGFNFGGDFILQFNENMGVGIGAGMLSATKESVLNYSQPGLTGTATHKISASAVPLRLGLFYFLPVSPSMNAVFNLGLGYYLGKANYTLTISGGGSTVIIDNDASGSGLGFHGGLGLEIALAPNMGILLDLSGRFASFGGFEGTKKNDGATASTGKLYAWDDTVVGHGIYHLIAIDSTLPSGSGISNAAEAKVAYTGFSLVAGLFVRF